AGGVLLSGPGRHSVAWTLRFRRPRKRIPLSSRGLGHGLFKSATRVRIPLGGPTSSAVPSGYSKPPRTTFSPGVFVHPPARSPGAPKRPRRTSRRTRVPGRIVCYDRPGATRPGGAIRLRDRPAHPLTL